jgi:hypothetical protein
MSNDEIARLEKLAEAAYTKMYDAPQFMVRECYENATRYLREAIAVAEQDGLKDVAKRLKERKDHIYNVYSHQFR